MKDAPDAVHHEQLPAISKLCDLFSNWIPSTTLSPPTSNPFPFPPIPVPNFPVQDQLLLPPPRVVSLPLLRVVPLPRVDPPPRVDPFQCISTHPSIAPTPMVFPSTRPVPPSPSQPVAHRTRYLLALTAHSDASRKYPSDFIIDWAFSVLDATTGQTVEHLQLQHHPDYKEVWDCSYSNKLGRLCQGFGSNSTNTGQRVKGTNTFKFIRYENIPHNRRKEITFSKVVCLFHPEKPDPNHTRITIGGNLICYPGDVGTKTASLNLIKIVLNSVLSIKYSKFVASDISNFYIQTLWTVPNIYPSSSSIFLKTSLTNMTFLTLSEMVGSTSKSTVVSTSSPSQASSPTSSSRNA